MHVLMFGTLCVLIKPNLLRWTSVLPSCRHHSAHSKSPLDLGRMSSSWEIFSVYGFSAGEEASSRIHNTNWTQKAAGRAAEPLYGAGWLRQGTAWDMRRTRGSRQVSTKKKINKNGQEPGPRAPLGSTEATWQGRSGLRAFPAAQGSALILGD